MARRSRPSQRMRPEQRGSFPTAHDFASWLPPLSSVEDLRRWDPEPLVFRSPLDTTGRIARFVVTAPKVIVHKRPFIARDYFTGFPRGVQVPVGIKVTSMFPVITCVRRKMRKAVMFALGKTGKGSKRRHRRRNDRSNVRC